MLECLDSTTLILRQVIGNLSHDRSCKPGTKVFFNDKAVGWNEQHLTTDSSIRQVAVKKKSKEKKEKATQSIQVSILTYP